jgi:hypothetical protein
MIWCIDTAAWISIDVPCAAEFVVFLDDGVGNAEPTERDAPRDGTDARTNDQNMLLRQGVGGRTLGPPCIASNKAHFLSDQGGIFRRDLFAETYTHHFQHEVVAGIGDASLPQGCAARAVDAPGCCSPRNLKIALLNVIGSCRNAKWLTLARIKSRAPGIVAAI